MRDDTRFYIDGRWVEPSGGSQRRLDVIDPATESVAGQISREGLAG